ncbi:hypothetical protein K493DRAFT_298554 [Basidiobolus meristosporus CBS 931.73]|uniref:Arrestin C-terminal-like domain-containing protein n=1 Tax=Basidiobolus meristosporus CBS 931.73 TaxID=1314790 RepID=A0A1Y1YST6_9FUNG|nr:hypothetical protein K493DRAFT_298554 [Basidiobolus meristosporus CBS 931.73]|eukprot:ORY01090.1 hypothetical protein K493DRAFT_298554 [Basidiobolus meristosporus CBS 931.73]
MVTIHHITSHRIEPLFGINLLSSRQAGKFYRDSFASYQQSFLQLPEGEYQGFQPGVYKYEFQIALNGDVPESIRARRGNISYLLGGLVKRQGIRSVLSVERCIQIERTLSPSSFEWQQPTHRAGELPDQCQFYVLIPTTSYTIGESIPITVGVIPLRTGVRMKRIHLRLMEATKYRTALKNWSKMHVHRVSRLNNPWKVGANDGEQLFELNIPTNSQLIEADSNTHYVRLKHYISIRLDLVDSSGDRQYLTLHLPIRILSANLKNLEDSLPTYDHAVLHPPKYEEFS